MAAREAAARAVGVPLLHDQPSAARTAAAQRAQPRLPRPVRALRRQETIVTKLILVVAVAALLGAAGALTAAYRTIGRSLP